MCGKAVGSCLLPLNTVPEWFVTSKTIEKFDSSAFSNCLLFRL